MLLACKICRAEDAVALPQGPDLTVVCRFCRRTQPRRLYDLAPPPAAPTGGGGPLLPIAVFLLLSGLGLGGVLLLGARAPGGLVVNLAMILAGAAAATMGTWVAQHPTALPVADNRGTDAFRMQQWGPSRRATRRDGLVNGLVFVGVGILVVGLGVFLGVLTRT